jgi:hypothetical protein
MIMNKASLQKSITEWEQDQSAASLNFSLLPHLESRSLKNDLHHNGRTLFFLHLWLTTFLSTRGSVFCGFSLWVLVRARSLSRLHIAFQRQLIRCPKGRTQAHSYCSHTHDAPSLIEISKRQLPFSDNFTASRIPLCDSAGAKFAFLPFLYIICAPSRDHINSAPPLA